jgi:preprotein translocase subunit SecA
MPVHTPDPSTTFLRQQKKTLDLIHQARRSLTELSDAQLAERFAALREKVKTQLGPVPDPLSLQDATAKVKEKKRLNQLLNPHVPEVFALVQEAARRAVGQEHFDVQLLGGIALHLGNVAEMRTGEGKTLVATLPLALNALTGRGAHLITVNDYLAKHAVSWYGPVYELLGITVGVIVHDTSYKFVPGAGDTDEPGLQACSRQEAYAADITYGTNNEFGFDYLRDNMAIYPERLAGFFVRSYCPPGGVVLDPFCGSGTTGAVAVRLGRRFVGFDVRPDQVELTRRRLSAETPDLFGGGA